MYFVNHLAALGQLDSAAQYARRAFEIDPARPNAWSDYAFGLYVSGKLDSALSVYKRALDFDSTTWTGYFVGMHAYLDAGRRKEADAAADKYLRLGGYKSSQALSYAASYYRRAGNTTRAHEILDSLNAMARRQRIDYSEIAAGRLAAGDRDGALDALETAVKNGGYWVADNIWMSLYPLRGHPRYEAARKLIYGDYPMPVAPFPDARGG
jgi:tetratricopeptide (TPR) repeat protein